MGGEQTHTPDNRYLIGPLSASFVPTAVQSLLLYEYGVEQHVIGSVVLYCCLLLPWSSTAL